MVISPTMKLFPTLGVSAFLLVAFPCRMMAAQDPSKDQTPKPAGHASPPSCKHCPPPEYPREAKGSKGDPVSVLLEFTVTEKGDAKEVKVLRDPGLPGFASKAVDAVKNWKFKLATDKDGTPVAARIPIELVFRKLN